MRQFLALTPHQDLGSLNGRFSTDRTFCLVGTDSRDYGAAGGLSRRSVGPISDGLVQIQNATVRGAPRAFVYRSHSGHYGIVNSEEGYQSLQRFLFGDVRASLLLDNVETTVPKKKRLTATYYIETVVSIRGIKVELHRRTIDSESAVFRSRDTLQSRPTHLHTAHLDRREIVGKKNKRGGSMGFLVRVRIVPEYHIDKKFWPDEHYEGAALFEDGLIFEISGKPGEKTQASFQWTSMQSEKPSVLELTESHDGTGDHIGSIPFKKAGAIKGDLVVRVSKWNAEPSAQV